MPPSYPPILLLWFANAFLAFSWIKPVRIISLGVGLLIVFAWIGAMVEYMLIVPADFIGERHQGPEELKTIRQIAILTVMGASLHLGSNFNAWHGAGVGIVALVVLFVSLMG